MRTLILSVLFALAVIGAGVAVFAHEIPDFSYKHEDGEAIRKNA
jgi:ABC-type Na+ efflux pump permease subunit